MITLEPITYSAGDVQELTGVSAVSQRNWRTRGFLPPLPEGKHYRANVFDMAMLKITAHLAERLPVADAVEIARISARAAARHALQHPKAWEGLPPALTPEALAQSALRQHYGKDAQVFPADYLIIWADGSEAWVADVNAALEAATFAQTGGAILLLDLAQIGFDLGAHGRPFMKVRTSQSEGESA